MGVLVCLQDIGWSTDMGPVHSLQGQRCGGELASQEHGCVGGGVPEVPGHTAVHADGCVAVRESASWVGDGGSVRGGVALLLFGLDS